MIGNTGSGTSTLLIQLSATTFQSGVRVHRGHIEDVYEKEVMLNGKPALSRDYDFKLYFIMQATNRSPGDEWMVMMSKVNECIKEANGSQVSFRVIVNQIMSKEVHNMYQQYLGHDSCKSLFQVLGAEILKFSFNMEIDGVTLLPFNADTVSQLRFTDVITDDARQRKHYTIRRELVLQVSYNNLKIFQDPLEAAK
ncbi:hypothetical protein BGZ52_009090 [Haplosporangium bisporale]|nr:hypothetical protein BGZ52_009090 [Haplosporangium bisporale]